MIPLSVPEISGNEWKYIKECLDTNWVSSAGSYVDLFEKKFGEYLGAQKAVVTMNGTAALHLALEALGIGPGDEVIVPSMTFISPVNAIRYSGAEPVFIDVCRDTYVLNTDRIEALLTGKTRAIMPVHIYGHPVDMDPLMEIAEKYGLYVIEDATESLGSMYKGKSTGTIGHIGCFSFNGNKLITTGAGGMLVTDDLKLGERAKYLSNQTKSIMDNGGFFHEEIGYNYRMPNLLAAMGVAQLENINKFIEVKKENAAFYNTQLSEVNGITIPVEKPWASNVNWLYSILVEETYQISRDNLILKLKANGIESRPFFYPVHKMKPYFDCKKGTMNTTDDISGRGINLPSSVSLKKEDIRIVCDVIKENA